ncbi:MAG: hypothetical protein ONB44_15880 [candidate division KSB1 bacterium]|nr:hypothetical protein [candidate division KSB1 bacterium]MDZ7303612.1 hypothetical protein [candidate division KSB1 bacterium]MDZ7312849.1 hypothetical protein [candidate division KSB1 bacterium]
MLPLHPEFRKMLLDDAALDTKARERQLTHRRLEEYDHYVGQHHLLRRALQGELTGTSASSRAAATRRIKKIKDALQNVDAPLKEMMATRMPAFHMVHARWVSSSQARELNQANRAYSSLLRPWRSERGGISLFFIFMGAFVVLGLISLIAMLPG